MPGEGPLRNILAASALELGAPRALGEREGIAVVSHLIATLHAVDKGVEARNIEVVFVRVWIGRIEKIDR